jgi:hypothetical protein
MNERGNDAGREECSGTTTPQIFSHWLYPIIPEPETRKYVFLVPDHPEGRYIQHYEGYPPAGFIITVFYIHFKKLW